jgi:hypothetical protein
MDAAIDYSVANRDLIKKAIYTRNLGLKVICLYSTDASGMDVVTNWLADHNKLQQSSAWPLSW